MPNEGDDIMSSIVTIAERKTREAERRGRAADAVMDELRDFVRTRGGRFYVFGSVAQGRIRYNSDLDILIDVPKALELAAWERVEEAGRRHGIAVDILTTAYASAEFLARVKSASIVIE